MFLFVGCSNEAETPYAKSVKEFHKKRIERLKNPNGWLSLVGLYWLKEGENSFGTDLSNDIVFPESSSPGNIGKFILTDSIVAVEIREGINVLNNNSFVTRQTLLNDMTGNPTILQFNSLSWYVIKRGERYGIRLKDSESQLLKNFDGIELFDIDPDWKIEAEFMKYDGPKKVEVPNIMGTVDTGLAYGKLLFTKDGMKHTLEPLGEENSLFLVFADMTNGEETYGAGRFLSLDSPDSTGKVEIDFNRAYNPPCVFTKFATCPLPNKSNILKIRVTAGEMNFHSAFH